MPKALLTATLLAVIFVTSASAQQRGGTDKEQQACARDVSKLCRKYINDADLVILACLKENRPKISRACNAVLVSNGQ